MPEGKLHKLTYIRDEMSEEDKLTVIMAMRVYPWLKRQLAEEAKERNQTLSSYLHDLIAAGWKKINEEDV